MDKDICGNKHGGNPESVAAFKTISPGIAKAQAEVLAAIEATGDMGLSIKEVASLLNKPFNAVSGRGTELKLAGKIKPSAERRNGSRVMIAVHGGTNEINPSPVLA